VYDAANAVHPVDKLLQSHRPHKAPRRGDRKERPSGYEKILCKGVNCRGGPFPLFRETIPLSSTTGLPGMLRYGLAVRVFVAKLHNHVQQADAGSDR